MFDETVYVLGDNNIPGSRSFQPLNPNITNEIVMPTPFLAANLSFFFSDNHSD